MQIQVNSNGRKRKALAEAVGNALGTPAVYNGPPNYAFSVGEVTIDRAGNLILPDPFDEEHLHNLLDGLRQKGFDVLEPMPKSESEAPPEPEAATTPTTETTSEPVSELPPEATAEAEPAPETATDSLVIQLPLEGFTAAALDNLDRLVASKASLIKKALDAETLPIERGEAILSFPWFSRMLSGEEADAYVFFISALCDMAKNQQRVMAVDKPVENEKYAFRCFLLRLGFIGDRYGNARRILLRNLSGDGSMKSGKPRAPKTASQAASVATEKTPDSATLSETGTASTTKPTPRGKFSLKKLAGALKLLGLQSTR